MSSGVLSDFFFNQTTKNWVYLERILCNFIEVNQTFGYYLSVVYRSVADVRNLDSTENLRSYLIFFLWRIVQGVFSVHEPLSAVREWIHPLLARPEMEFSLSDTVKSLCLSIGERFSVFKIDERNNTISHAFYEQNLKILNKAG